VISVTPVAQRGATLGSVIGAATFGTLIGPLLGTMAVATSTSLVFSAVGAISLGLAAWVQTRANPTALQATLRPRGARPTLRSPVSRGLFLGGWMVLLEAMIFGATNVLLPLRLARFGASGVVIGIAFLGAAALSAALSTMVGRITDRRGPRLPITLGLLFSAILIPALVLPHSPVLLAILAVIALGGPMTGYMIPAVSTMTDSAEHLGIALVVASTLFNLAYAAGETIGAPAAAVISQASGDAVALVGLGALMLLTLIPARNLRRPPASGPGADDRPQPEPARRPDPAVALHG
jgi:predicted MFS family arabinose efflux permease